MTTLTEAFHGAGFLISESNGFRSRDQVTILSGENLLAGQVVAKITASGKYVALSAEQSAESDGSTTAAGILYNAVDASAGDVVGTVILRDAEVNANELVWASGFQASEKNAALVTLKTLGIIARPSTLSA